MNLKVVGFELCKTWKQLAAILCHVDLDIEHQLYVKEKSTAEVAREDPHRFQGWVAVRIKGAIWIK